MSDDNELDLLTRLCFTPLALATAIFGPVLLLFPGSTEDYWAWPIQPAMSAAFIGSAYTFGAVALTLMLVQGRWVTARIPVASTLPFACVMLATTIIHNDRFSTGTVQYGVWLAIYIVLPVVLPAILVLNRSRGGSAKSHETRLPRRLRVAFVAAGVAAGALGLVMVVAPDALREDWPWALSPLMSRVVGGWLLFLATGGLAAIVETRYAAYRYYLPAGAFWFGLLLVTSVVQRDDFDSDGMATPLYFAAVSLAVVGLLAVFLVMERRLQTAAGEAE